LTFLTVGNSGAALLDTPVDTPTDAASDGPATPLCFLLDEDFVYRQEVARTLRGDGIEVVEFSNSERLANMVDAQRPDIVFIDMKRTAPHECIRALLALKECSHAGAVLLFGHCDQAALEAFTTVGADCSLTMLPPLRKPFKASAIRKIVLELALVGPTTSSSPSVSLAEALRGDMIKFLYQPKFDLKTNTMIGAEVVARVAHPKHGLLTPDQFLKGADEDSLLKLSRMALTKALKTSVHLHGQGISLQISINIDVESLVQLPISDIVKLYRPDGGNWPGVLLEMPERQVVGRIDFLKARAPKLVQQPGVAIAVDNFGCGACRWDILNQLPFAEIKIDRSLVHGCAENPGNARICKTLIQMAHNFGSRAAAVGIANQADRLLMEKLDCDVGQGFLLSRPMTLKQIDTLIESFKSRSA
jgi:EAL domain-containing protein (putative c-di-GMP-specific phosphodiesterase class I)